MFFVLAVEEPERTLERLFLKLYFLELLLRFGTLHAFLSDHLVGLCEG